MNKYKFEIEKLAASKWKREYHNLSEENKDMIRKNTMKNSGQIAEGIQRGNDNLIKKLNITELNENNQYQNTKSIKGQRYINTPDSLADFDIKNSNLPKSDKRKLKAFHGHVKPHNLSDNDKKLFNAVSRRNSIVNGTHGFDAQMVSEGSFAPYYEDKNFSKKIKTSRASLYGGNNKKEVFKNYGNKLDVKNDMRNSYKKSLNDSTKKFANNETHEFFPFRDGDVVASKYRKNKDFYKKLANKSNFNKKVLKVSGIAGVSGLAGLVGTTAIKNYKNRKKETNNEQV